MQNSTYPASGILYPLPALWFFGLPSMYLSDTSLLSFYNSGIHLEALYAFSPKHKPQNNITTVAVVQG
ncbi:hypothetical protein HYR99_24785 [Candidatus Poribacteria bacterium]|nr:hypothetical protein [Candidatus Poribacteria bacterium]